MVIIVGCFVQKYLMISEHNCLFLRDLTNAPQMFNGQTTFTNPKLQFVNPKSLLKLGKGRDVE